MQDKYPHIDSAKEWLRLEKEKERKAAAKKTQKSSSQPSSQGEPSQQHGMKDHEKSIKICDKTAQI